MLKEMPHVGQIVVAKQDSRCQGVKYLTKDKRYEIKGKSTFNGSVCHLDDRGSTIYIANDSFGLYDLVNPFKIDGELKENPKIGECVIALHDVYDTLTDFDREFEEVRRITINKKYEIVGEYGSTNSPYFVDDSGQNYYIDNEVWHYFELAKARNRVLISPMGLTVDGRDYHTNAADILLQFRVITNPDNLLDTLLEFENDINELIRNKYSN